MDLGQDFDQRVDEDGRETERHLVDQQHLRPCHERPPDGDLLLLAAGQPSREICVALAQPRQQCQDPLEVGVDLPVGAQVCAHAEVVFDGERGEEPAALRHLHDACAHDAVRFEPGEFHVAETRAAAGGGDQGANRRQQCRFACSVGADEGHDLAGLDAHRDIPQHLRVAVARAEILDRKRLEDRRRARHAGPGGGAACSARRSASIASSCC